MRKEGWIWILIGIVLVFGIYIIINEFNMRSPPQCNIDGDCTPIVERFCGENNSMCNFTTIYRCVQLATGEKECQPEECLKVCEICEFGCSDGYCLGNPDNKSDLIVYGVGKTIYRDIEEVVLSIFVKNNGTAPSPVTITRVTLPSGEIFPLETDSISPGGYIWVANVSYSQPAGSNYDVLISADADDDADEINENNNELEITISMPL